MPKGRNIGGSGTGAHRDHEAEGRQHHGHRQGHTLVHLASSSLDAVNLGAVRSGAVTDGSRDHEIDEHEEYDQKDAEKTASTRDDEAANRKGDGGGKQKQEDGHLL